MIPTRIEGRGVAAEALCAGQGNPLAVLLHAAGASRRALVGLAEALAPDVGRLLIPDLPSAATGGAVPLARQIAVARAAIDRADGTCLVFGHSFGGLVALLAVLEDPASEGPGSEGAEVDAVVLYEPIVIACLDEADPLDRSAKAWDRALIDFLAERTQAGDPEPGVRRFIEAYNEVSWTELPDRARRKIVSDAADMVSLTQAVHHQWLDLARLSRLEVPVLVLHGDRSPEATRRMAAALSDRLPRARLTRVEGCGHMAPALAPGKIAAVVAEFLAQSPMEA